MRRSSPTSSLLLHRDLFFEIHNNKVMEMDAAMAEMERKYQVNQYRRSLLKFARGNVLETGVGSSRNIDLYPQDCKVTGVDYSPAALELALTKGTVNQFTYRLEDVEQ